MKEEARQALKQLIAHYESDLKNSHMRDMFDKDPERFNRFSVEFKEAELLFDYSKNIITEDTMKILFNICRSAGLEQAINDMFSGKHINVTEDRAVLHVALRDPNGSVIIYLNRIIYINIK